MVVSVVPTEKGVDVICLDGGELRGFHCRKCDLCLTDFYRHRSSFADFAKMPRLRRQSFSTTRGLSPICILRTGQSRDSQRFSARMGQCLL